MRIIFATVAGSPLFSKILTDAGAGDRLLSFYELQEARPGYLEHFIKTGLSLPGRGASARKIDWSASGYLKFRRMALYQRIEEYDALGPDEPEE